MDDAPCSSTEATAPLLTPQEYEPSNNNRLQSPLPLTTTIEYSSLSRTQIFDTLNQLCSKPLCKPKQTDKILHKIRSLVAALNQTTQGCEPGGRNESEMNNYPSWNGAMGNEMGLKGGMGSDGCVPLVRACAVGNFQIAELLISLGANVNQQENPPTTTTQKNSSPSWEQNAALHTTIRFITAQKSGFPASKKRREKGKACVDWLVCLCRANLMVRNRMGVCPWMIACEAGDRELMEQLAIHIVPIPPHFPHILRFLALPSLSKLSHQHTLLSLLHHNNDDDIHAHTQGFSNANISSGGNRLLSLLQSADCAVDVVSQRVWWGGHPFGIATKSRGNPKLSSVDSNDKSRTKHTTCICWGQHRTPLQIACGCGTTCFVGETPAQSNTNRTTTTNNNSNDLQIESAIEEHVRALEMVRVLVSVGGADPHVVAKGDGWTALHCAVAAGNLLVTQWLVESVGVNVNAKTFCGETAFDLARRYNRMNIVNYLQRNPLVVQTMSRRQLSEALVRASVTGDESLAKAMLCAGADPLMPIVHPTHSFASGAVGHALRCGNNRIVELIRLHVSLSHQAAVLDSPLIDS